MNERILQQCEELMKKGSTSFHKAFDVLPSPRREAVHVIYAFCRIIDDSVDEPGQSPYSIHELMAHFSNLEQAEGHFIWPALRWLFSSFPQLRQEPFQLQMEGQLRDLSFTQYQSMQQLESYCYLVAGTVGEMLLPVLREDQNEAAQAAGISLGIGMQLVNIIRDVGEDLRRGRRYVPLEVMERNGYSQQELENGEINEQFIAVLHELKAEALKQFEKGLVNVHTYPWESGLAIELAASFYAAILDAVEADGYDVFRKRSYVSDEAKLRLFRRVVVRYTGVQTVVV
ncbi:phytoene/squalene synthase family protein [Paenibacillus sp. MMS20-IR301]|uniref:phytoene/squalene synthase family protein n=1 Tax=Paenibacillus sp. MMS20-IR301 TaxID=2895946 RepID=UPI0028E6FA28|nr:phytoene/squalene synthase family protein [Paenibacillus sp. MMS20-IR301]WNS42605.1 phytoene/squalene synthase family protein [Paenibacillus sp. MMS20-IR301]